MSITIELAPELQEELLRQAAIADPNAPNFGLNPDATALHNAV